MPAPGEHKSAQAGVVLHQLMTAQIRVNDLDVEGILAQAVREYGDGLSSISVSA